VVWWVRAENPLTLIGDYAALADALALPERDAPEQDVRAAAVTDWCERHPRWLVVFDNAPSPQAVRGLLPHGRGGHVLITSRQHGGWRGIAEPRAVDVWSRDESREFLGQRTGDADTGAADALADALGDLPLALEQAAAYIDTMQISLEGYLRRLRSHAPTLFERGRVADYEHTIATTWEVSFAELEADPRCRAVLFCCAFLASERIPRTLLASTRIAEGSFTGADGELALDDTIAHIMSFSLLTATDESTLSMHRLVQHVIRNRLTDQRDQWLSLSYDLLADQFPAAADEPGSWPTCEALLPDVLAGCEHATDAARRQASVLLDRAGRYLGARGEYGAAVSVLERALALGEAADGPEHPDTLTSRNNLASAYQAAGRVTDAIPLFEATLTDRERILGLEHPNTLSSRNNLALAYRDARRVTDAIPLFEATLTDRERTLGPEHPATRLVRDRLRQIQEG
jgi:tetratricopeptide (TPR) repeat protein